ncbi:hypothetical protein D1871_04495 [Nakamurella silvestris]|nr:hypothetical protein D1871_04495 [Nakamurella silvestris]
MSNSHDITGQGQALEQPNNQDGIASVTVTLPVPALALLYRLLWTEDTGLVDQMHAGAQPWLTQSAPFNDESTYRWTLETLSESVPMETDEFVGEVLIAHRIPDLESYVGSIAEAHRELPAGIYAGMERDGATDVTIAVGESSSYGWHRNDH